MNQQSQSHDGEGINSLKRAELRKRLTEAQSSDTSAIGKVSHMVISSSPQDLVEFWKVVFRVAPDDILFYTALHAAFSFPPPEKREIEKSDNAENSQNPGSTRQSENEGIARQSQDGGETGQMNEIALVAAVLLRYCWPQFLYDATKTQPWFLNFSQDFYSCFSMLSLFRFLYDRDGSEKGDEIINNIVNVIITQELQRHDGRSSRVLEEYSAVRFRPDSSYHFRHHEKAWYVLVSLIMTLETRDVSIFPFIHMIAWEVNIAFIVSELKMKGPEETRGEYFSLLLLAALGRWNSLQSFIDSTMSVVVAQRMVDYWIQHDEYVYAVETLRVFYESPPCVRKRCHFHEIPCLRTKFSETQLRKVAAAARELDVWCVHIWLRDLLVTSPADHHASLTVYFWRLLYIGLFVDNDFSCLWGVVLRRGLPALLKICSTVKKRNVALGVRVHWFLKAVNILRTVLDQMPETCSDSFLLLLAPDASY